MRRASAQYHQSHFWTFICVCLASLLWPITQIKSTSHLNSSSSRNLFANEINDQLPSPGIISSQECQSHVNVFHCKGQQNEKICLPLVKTCDGYPDCLDESDESPELCGCLKEEFFCNGTCIPSIKRCDRFSDCPDGEDEKNCETFGCASSHFKCDNHFCVPNDKVCDFYDNCGDSSDERNCVFRRCWHGEYTCKSGQCVQMYEVCNGIQECADGSDEETCSPADFVECNFGNQVHVSLWCDNWTDCVDSHLDELNCRDCYDGEFKCPNSRCIQQWNLCDGVCDCISGCEDERQCGDQLYSVQNGLTQCNENQSVQCLSSSRCISKEYMCDGHSGCPDAKALSIDELGCGATKSNCEAADNFWCSEGRCLPASFRCNHRRDCLTDEDEKDCEFPLCEDSQFRCTSGQCIPLELYCDTRIDCLDASDETKCTTHYCPGGYFRCSSGQCLPSHWVCDYRKDCPNGEDEVSCVKNLECKKDEFRCKNGQCVANGHHCFFDGDSRNGCADRSHLINCSNWTCATGQMKCKNGYCINAEMVCDSKIDCQDSWTDELGCPFQCSHEPRCPCIDVSINCSSLKLKSIPKNIEPEISRLIFSNNQLGTNLGPETFKGLEKAQILDLSKNEISQIPVGTFETLWQLKVLYLNSNRIDVVSERNFYGLSNLRSLVLTGNQIKRIDAFGFSGLSVLKSLALSNQGLENISRDAFLGMRSLANLDLSNNSLTELRDGCFNGLTSLIHLDLSHNRVNVIEPLVFRGLNSLQKLITDEFRFCCLVPSNVQCLPEPDEFSSCEDLMSNVVLRVCVWILGTIAFTGNTLVIVWRLKHRARNSVHSFLIANLAVGDLLMGVYLLIIAVIDGHYRGVYFIYDHEWRQSFLCQFAGFLSTLSSESSVFTLTVVTLDRFITIVFPFRIRRLQLVDFIFVMFSVWLLSLCLAATPLLPIEYFKNFYGRSGVCLALHITHQRPNGWEYSVFVFIGLNLISFTIIAVAYGWMFFAARSSGKAARTYNANKKSITMARRIMVIIFTDFFCWMPIIFLGFLSLSDITIAPQVFAWVAVFVLPLNAALNPLIYTIFTPMFTGCGTKGGKQTHLTRHSETQKSILDTSPGSSSWRSRHKWTSSSSRRQSSFTRKERRGILVEEVNDTLNAQTFQNETNNVDEASKVDNVLDLNRENLTKDNCMGVSTEFEDTHV